MFRCSYFSELPQHRRALPQRGIIFGKSLAKHPKHMRSDDDVSRGQVAGVALSVQPQLATLEDHVANTTTTTTTTNTTNTIIY